MFSQKTISDAREALWSICHCLPSSSCSAKEFMHVQCFAFAGVLQKLENRRKALKPHIPLAHLLRRETLQTKTTALRVSHTPLCRPILWIFGFSLLSLRLSSKPTFSLVEGSVMTLLHYKHPFHCLILQCLWNSQEVSQPCGFILPWILQNWRSNLSCRTLYISN